MLSDQVAAAPLVPKSVLVKPRSKLPASGQLALVEVWVHGAKALVALPGQCAGRMLVSALSSPSASDSEDSMTRSLPLCDDC